MSACYSSRIFTLYICTLDITYAHTYVHKVFGFAIFAAISGSIFLAPVDFSFILSVWAQAPFKAHG